MAPREVPGSGILTTEGLPTLFSCESNSYTRIHLIRCSFEYVSPASEKRSFLLRLELFVGYNG